MATRDVLVEAAEAAPVVILVDDLPWIDRPTRRLLAYIAETLDVERVAIVSTRRIDATARTETGSRLELAALPDDVAEQVLIDGGVTSPAVRGALVGAAGGVPLVLIESANLLDPDERTGRAALPDPLPIGRSSRRVAELVLERVEPSVRSALVVAAADTEGDLDRITRALADQGLGVAELRAAQAGGVIRLDGSARGRSVIR